MDWRMEKMKMRLVRNTNYSKTVEAKGHLDRSEEAGTERVAEREEETQ